MYVLLFLMVRKLSSITLNIFTYLVKISPPPLVYLQSSLLLPLPFLPQDNCHHSTLAQKPWAWLSLLSSNLAHSPPHIIFFFFFILDLFILEGLVISKRHLSIFSIKTVTLLVFFSPNWSPKRPHQRREHFKPIKLQDAPLTDLTETSSKKGDWVGKETLKDQHTASPQIVESSHRQRPHHLLRSPHKYGNSHVA